MRMRFGLMATVVVTAAVILTGICSQQASAVSLSRTSPTPDSMVLVSNGNTGMTRHILIRSDHGIVNTLKLAVYYSAPVSSAQTVNITGNGATSGLTKCQFAGPVAGSTEVVNVRFASGGAAQSYNIQKRDVCTTGNTNGPNTSRPKFYAAYKIPQSVINGSYDAATGKYKVVMTVRYMNTGQLPIHDPGQLLTFGVQINTTGALVGNIDTDDSSSDPNNGIVGKGDNQVGNIKVVYPFGLSCDANDVVQNQKVSLYDADNNGGTNELRFKIQKKVNGNWVTLKKNEYTGISNATYYPAGASGNTAVSIEPNPGDNNVPASVKIKEMTPTTHYQMIVQYLHKRGDSRNNYIYVGLPGDSIFGADNFSCRDINNNYTLTPQVGIAPNDVVESGQKVTGSPSVKNVGPTKSNDTDWRLNLVVFAPGVNPSPGAGTSNSAACDYFAAAQSCTLVASGHQVFNKNPAVTDLASHDKTVGNLEAGSTVCFALSIKPWKVVPGDAGGSNWRHSALACAVVARRPKVHIEGGDLKVGGDIKTSTSRISGKTFGSWVEYGIFSTGSNEVTASGGGLAGGNTDDLLAHWSQLTFANTPDLGHFILGSYSSAHDYFMQQEDTQTASGSLTLSGTGRHIINAGSNITIDASTIPIGGTFIIKATGTVTIAGDIEYDTASAITHAKDIPQVVIAATNINIKQNVQRVDAWLLASGSINTCSDGPTDALTIDNCKWALMVNGPVSTRTLHVRRTAGATAAEPGSAAETFRLTPTTYLWARDFSGQSDRVKTVYITEQPPRF